MQNKEALEILLGALSDAEWMQLKHLRETKFGWLPKNTTVKIMQSVLRW